MANGPDPRYIPHLYCTVLGSVMGPIGLRRLSMETGGVELLNTLFEIQSKMNTLYDLYLWRHWIWLFENEFEVEGLLAVINSNILEFQERIWSAETYARIVWLYERTPDETNILATLLQVAGNPNCHSVFTDPDETIELFLKMAYSLPNRNATLGAVALGCLSVSPVFTQRLLDHKDVTQLFDSVLRSIPLQSMTELSSFLCGDMESVWASLRPFTQLLKSPLTVAQVCPPSLPTSQQKLLGLCWLATFCHKQEERIMLAQYNGFSDIVLLSFSKNETLSQLAQTCLEHVKDLPKNAPSLQEMCVRVAVETNNLKVKDQVTLLPADILSAYPALVYQQDSA